MAGGQVPTHRQIVVDMFPRTGEWNDYQTYFLGPHRDGGIDDEEVDNDKRTNDRYGLCMSASDMAKIGQLCLNKGVWEGKRIISEGWISEMTKPREVESKFFRGMQYGYLWWIIHPEKKIYAAIGNCGNVIYVNPEEDIVVAVSSYFKPTVFDRVDFIEDTLLPCFG